MLRQSLSCRKQPGSMMNPLAGDKRSGDVKITKAVGIWLYKAETMKRFMAWCNAHHVKARGRVRICGSDHHARCLRTTREIAPGEALVTAPLSATINFLTVTKLMFQESNHNFPLQINFQNWNERLRYLPGAATHDLVSAGWLARMHCNDDERFGPYASWLMEDTSGRDGIAHGIKQERQQREDREFDDTVQDMAYEAGEEADDFIEDVFKGLACFLGRGVPIETRAVQLQLPGTNFDNRRVSLNDMFAPTLIPLVDCVPHKEDGTHNVMVEFIPEEDLKFRAPAVCKEMNLNPDDFADDGVVESFGGGLFALRAMTTLPEGEFPYVRGWPKTGNPDDENVKMQLMEMQRIQHNQNSA